MKYKVGDRVKIKSLDWYNENKNQFGRVICGSKSYTTEMCFFCGKTLTIQAIGLDFYLMEEDNLGYEFTDEMIEGLVEEEGEKKLSDESWRYKDIFDRSQYPQSFECPKGYIFKDDNGNVINATKIVLEKKKKEYPKTYEECAKLLNTYCGSIGGYNWKLLSYFQQLLICRDAYWKRAGEEMGLRKPWEPSQYEMVYTIYRHSNKIGTEMFLGKSVTFEFPTPEMRDAFKENFYPDIEICKELL